MLKADTHIILYRSYSVATISFHKKIEKHLKNQEIATKVVRYFIAMTRATE